MASSICHAFGVTKRRRLERIVRRDHPAEVKRPQGRLNRSLDNRAHPASCQRRTLRSQSFLGRHCFRDHAPTTITEGGEP